MLINVMTEIKLSLDSEVRKTSFDLSTETLNYEKLQQLILKFFPILDGKSYRVCYHDEEKLITFSSNEELEEAIKFMLSRTTTLQFTLLMTTTEGGKDDSTGSYLLTMSNLFFLQRI